MTDKTLKPPEFTDIGAGFAFADLYSDRVKYVSEQGAYYIYPEPTAPKWIRDNRELIQEWGKKFVSQDLLRMAAATEDDDDRMEFLKYIPRVQSNRARAEILRSARSVPSIAASITDFDQNPNIIGLLNGAYDLAEGRYLMPNPKLMLSKTMNADYDPDARCPRWEQFIIEIMDGDGERELFLQTLIGYALLGNPTEDCMGILDGRTTRNGKSTFGRSILNVYGDYGCNIQPDTLAVNKYRSGSGPNPDKARLHNIRFALASEPSKDMVFDAANLKQMTGRDPITARFLNQEFFEFIPRFVLCMNTNHLPRIDDMTLFSSGRIFVIPFDVHFPENKRELNLLEQFSTPQARSAILNWILDGVALYRAQGLRSNVPEAVKAATRQYCEDSDTFGRFLGDCVVDCQNAWTGSSVLYQEYEKWAQDNGHHALSSKNFSLELKSRGYRDQRKTAGNGFLHIMLKSSIPKEWRRDAM